MIYIIREFIPILKYYSILEFVELLTNLTIIKNRILDENRLTLIFDTLIYVTLPVKLSNLK